MNDNKKNWTWNKFFAIFLLMFLFIASCIILPPIYRWSIENNNFQNKMTSHVVFSFDFDNKALRLQGTKPDLQVDVSLSYPHGSIIVDDPINISAIAIINESIPNTITRITIGFQNALAYPVKQNEDGITNDTNLFLWKKEGNKITGENETITWEIEGTYSPSMIVVYENETGGHAIPTYTSDVVITVYPKIKLMEIVNNNISIILSIAVYFLSIIGTFSLVFLLWDRKPSSKNKQNNTKYNNDESNIIDNNAKIIPTTIDKNRTKKKKENTEHKNS